MKPYNLFYTFLHSFLSYWAYIGMIKLAWSMSLLKLTSLEDQWKRTFQFNAKWGWATVHFEWLRRLWKDPLQPVTSWTLSPFHHGPLLLGELWDWRIEVRDKDDVSIVHSTPFHTDSSSIDRGSSGKGTLICSYSVHLTSGPLAVRWFNQSDFLF